MMTAETNGPGRDLAEIRRIAGYVENELQGRLDATAWGKLRPLLDLCRAAPPAAPPDGTEYVVIGPDDLRWTGAIMAQCTPAAPPEPADAMSEEQENAAMRVALGWPTSWPISAQERAMFRAGLAARPQGDPPREAVARAIRACTCTIGGGLNGNHTDWCATRAPAADPAIAQAQAGAERKPIQCLVALACMRPDVCMRHGFCLADADREVEAIANTPPAAPPEPAANCARCDDTGCPECDPEWAQHQVRAPAPAILANDNKITEPAADASDLAAAIARVRRWIGAYSVDNEDLLLICDAAARAAATIEQQARDLAELSEWDIRKWYADVQKLEPGSGMSHEDGWTLMRRDDAERLTAERDALVSLADARGRAVDAAVAMRARWGKYDLINDDDSDCMEAFDAALAAIPKE